MNVAALNMLECLLREDASNKTGARFDLRKWIAPYSEQGEGDTKREKWKPALDCGTAACAIGLAMMHPWFNERGFHFNLHNIPAYTNENNLTYVQWNAICEFFDIYLHEAEYLFSANNYGRHMGTYAEISVADRIRKFTNLGSQPVQNT